MKEALNDLKSFITVSMIMILAFIIIGSMFGLVLDEKLLLLFTNLITACFTYYFAKKDDSDKVEEEEDEHKAV